MISPKRAIQKLNVESTYRYRTQVQLRQYQPLFFFKKKGTFNSLSEKERDTSTYTKFRPASPLSIRLSFLVAQPPDSGLPAETW